MTNTETKPKETPALQDPKGEHLLPEGLSLNTLQEFWNTAESEYVPVLRKMMLLDAADNGDIWDYIAKKFPEYQIAPDTNHVNDVKANIQAAIYSVGKSASLLPMRLEDVETVNKINSVLERIWDTLEVSQYQMQAGERAALLNLGITQVGWNQDIVAGTHGSWYKGDVVFKNIDPICFRKDPYALNLEDGQFCGYYDYVSKNILLSHSNYSERMKEILATNAEVGNSSSMGYKRKITPGASAKDYFKLIYMWVKVPRKDGKGYDVHEVHTLDNAYVLYVKKAIQPTMYPFAELYCNLPVHDPVGVSEPQKIFQSSMVVNLLDGLMATHAYKAQRPPRLISAGSGLNLRNFAKYGNDPDKAFIVNGRPDDVVKYVSFPSLPPEIPGLAQRLDQNIQKTSGVSDAYKGTDTGSITTTGGIDAMLAQATARDVNKINNYEAYAKRLTRLVISYMVQYADKRAYAMKDTTQQYRSVELDFPKIPSDIQFAYAVHISNDLPKNKQRLSAMADMLMEKQLQYQQPGQPALITQEEWLMLKELPIKDLMLSRMKLERESNETQEITETLFMFAGLIEQGMPPEQAIQMIVEQKQMQNQPQSLGNTGIPAEGLAGSPQARQMG